MSDDEAKPEAAQPQGSVFGNLPESRPGTRSPRRDRGAAKPKTTKAKAAAKPRAKAAAKPRAKAAARPKSTPKAAPPPRDQAPKPPRASPPPRPPADDRPDAETGEGQRAGLEEIAWAGVAAAAEAATLGVRLANRAFEALRGNSERS